MNIPDRFLFFSIHLDVFTTLQYKSLFVLFLFIENLFQDRMIFYWEEEENKIYAHLCGNYQYMTRSVRSGFIHEGTSTDFNSVDQA